LAPVAEPRWLVVRDPFRTALEVTEIPPGADLRSILASAREVRIAGGWDAQEIGRSCGFFFCTKADQRLEIAIEAYDPAQPIIWHR
jgi:hypothetical protein